MTARTECDCGDCRACRRALGLTPTPTATVVLSESTRRILAGLDTPTPPRKRAATPAVIRPRRSQQPEGWCRKGLHRLEGDNVRTSIRGGRTVRECRPCLRDRVRVTRQNTARGCEKPDPVPCVECGGMIGAKISGYSGWVLAAEDGKCEVCKDKPKFARWLAEYEQIPAGARTMSQRTRATKARKHLERILRDGRAFHPDARHGAGQAYLKYGCRCTACSGWKAADNKMRRERAA